MESDEPVVGNSEVKKLEDRVRELEGILGRKTVGGELLKEALEIASGAKRLVALAFIAKGKIPMTAVCDTFGFG